MSATQIVVAEWLTTDEAERLFAAVVQKVTGPLIAEVSDGRSTLRTRESEHLSNRLRNGLRDLVLGEQGGTE